MFSGGRARTSEEDDAVEADEAGGGEGRRQRQQRADHGEADLQLPLLQQRAVEDGLKQHPFRHEAVERRQGRDRGGADQAEQRGRRHPVDQPAQLVELALPGGGQDGARREEQDALEQAVIEHVEHGGGHGERRQGRHAGRLEHQRQTQPDDDDADILDRRIGQQLLHVVLHQRVEHADHGGHRADDGKDAAPPPERLADQIEQDADQAVYGDLGHDPAHQRGNMAGCGGVGQRQPDMQRHQTGLRPRPQQDQQRRDAGGYRVRRMRADAGEAVIARRSPPACRSRAAGRRCRSSP